MRRPATRTGFAMVVALGLSGIGTGAADEPVPHINHPPMPVPEMPVPPGFTPISPVAPPALAPAPLEVPIPLAPALTTGFAGLGDNICSLVAGGCTIPPDTHGAAGPNQLMEVLNTEVHVQDPYGAVVWGPMKIDDFWAPVNPPIPPATDPDGVFDPRVHYDPFDDRWITVACDEKATPHPDESAILVGVSVTGDATGAWYLDRIDADAANLVWADYPNVGFNSKWVAVQVNLFNVSDSQFNRSHIYVFDKTELYAGTFNPTLFTLLTQGEPPADRYGGTQVPATTYDPAEPDLYLLQKWNAGAGLLRLYWITGPAGAPVLQGLNTDTPRWAQSPAIWARAAPGAPDDFAPQIDPPAAIAGCETCATPPCLIQTNDDRIQNVVLRNGNLWATHTIFLPAGGPTRSSVQWWQIDPSNPINPLQRGRVDDTTGNRFFAFPSIAVNKHEDVLLGYSSFEGSQYASGSYSFRTFYDPPNTMQPESIAKDGDACYLKDFTDFGTGRNRWGDYSATVVDADDTRLWTLQEYAAFPDPTELEPWFRDKWGTWWGMLDTTRMITIADVSQAEGDVGPTPFVFTLTLSAPTPLPVTVTWDTGDGTATVVDGDYVGVAGGLVTFAPGETTQTLTVDVNGDIKWEVAETFVVDLSAPTNAALADNQATGTILNDDPLPQITIGDLVRVEGDAGEGNNLFVFPVSLTNPSSAGVQADWATMDGSASAGLMAAGHDYFAGAGTVVFAPGDTSETVTVQVHGDTVFEPDEAFYVDLTGPTGGTLLKPRGVGTIVDDDAVEPGVEALSVVSSAVGSLPTDGENQLQWLTPAGATGAVQFLIKYNRSAGAGGSCTPPDPNNPGTASFGLFTQAPVLPGTSQGRLHGSLNLDYQYCYTVWIEYPGPTYSLPGVTMSARPFDSTTSKVKWKVFSGMTALAQPTVGHDAVVTPANDAYLHAMARGASGGPWTAPWRPRRLSDISQQRSPIVPLAGGSRIFVSTQDGRVHAVDTADGSLLWSTQLPEGAAVGAPAGIFTAFGGAYDYVFAGTSAGGGDRLYALDPFTGAVIDAFPQPVDAIGGNVGAILGMPSVDYANRRVFFASRIGTTPETVWCLDLGPPSDALRLGWRRSTNDIDGSVVLHGGRVYLGTVSSEVYSFRASDGLDSYTVALGDGPIRGFLFPDFRNNDLYVATNGKVWAVTDTGVGLNTSKWATEPSLVAPSVVLHHPGTDDIYVGVRDYLGSAAVVKIDAATGAIVSHVPLEPAPETVGPPALDLGYGMLHMGSEAGILYAVEVPF